VDAGRRNDAGRRPDAVCCPKCSRRKPHILFFYCTPVIRGQGPFAGRARAEITAISDCNVANERQSKAECIDRRRGEDTFLQDIKVNPQFFGPPERRKTLRVPAAIMTGNNPQ